MKCYLVFELVCIFMSCTVYHTLSRTEILFFFAFITHLVVRQQLDHTFSREMRAQSHIKSRVNYYQEIQNSKTKIQICTIEKKTPVPIKENTTTKSSINLCHPQIRKLSYNSNSRKIATEQKLLELTNYTLKN